MKTPMINSHKKEESQSMSSIASLLTSFMNTKFQSKVSQYENANLTPESPFHQIAGLKFLSNNNVMPALRNLANMATQSQLKMGAQPQGLKIGEPHAVSSQNILSELETNQTPEFCLPENSESLASLQIKQSSVKQAVQGSSDIQDIVNEASQKYDVPVAFINAIIKQESAFNPQATSHCGAMGLMQLMPATAKAYGCQDGYDARQNVMAGTSFLKDLLTKYKGNMTLAAAGYNAGPGNVAKYGNQVPPFKETQDYVTKVKANYESNLAALERSQDQYQRG